VSDPELVPELLDYLRWRNDVVVEQVDVDEIEASLVGSYGAEAHRLELDLRLRAWQSAHPGVDVELD
jgi:hypothetical protein